MILYEYAKQCKHISLKLTQILF